MRTSTKTSVVTIGQFVAVLRRHLVLILATVTTLTVLAVLLLQLMPKTYEATAVVDLSPTLNADSSTAAIVSTSTEGRIVSSLSVARLAAKELSSSEAPEDLAELVSVTSPQSSEVLDITYAGGTAAEAADGANAFAEAYLAYRAETTLRELTRRAERMTDEIAVLQAQLLKLAGESGQQATTQRSLAQGQIAQLQSQLSDYRTDLPAAAQLAGPASVPSTATSPRPIVNLAGGLLLGLLLGIVLALLRDRRDDRIRSWDEVQDAAGLVVLADVPGARTAGGTLAVFSEPRGAEADAYRMVTATVSPANGGGASRSILVCCPDHSRGFNQVPLNLAATFALQGLRTVLAGTNEATVRHAGLLEIYVGDHDPSTFFRARLRGPGTVANLRLLPLGDEVTVGATMRSNDYSLEEVLRDTDVVIVDGVNTELASTSLVLSQIADAGLILVHKNRTQHEDLDRTLNQMEKAGVPIAGALLLPHGKRTRERVRNRPPAKRTPGRRSNRPPAKRSGGAPVQPPVSDGLSAEEHAFREEGAPTTGHGHHRGG